MYPNQTLIDALIRHIMGTVQPLRIVLFGSAARGEMRPDSDIDVLIVMPEGAHGRRTAQDVHQQLFGFPLSVDVLVATPADLRKHKDNIGLVYHRALREGKEIYATGPCQPWVIRRLAPVRLSKLRLGYQYPLPQDDRAARGAE